MADKVLTFEEVSQHNTSRDCWLIIHGKVYDVSKFIEEHPGGEHAMLNVTGKDASLDFEDIGHSTYAEGLMKDFCIGKIDELTLPNITTSKAVSSTVSKDSANSSSTSLLYILPLLILGVVFLSRFYSENE